MTPKWLNRARMVATPCPGIHCIKTEFGYPNNFTFSVILSQDVLCHFLAFGHTTGVVGIEIADDTYRPTLFSPFGHYFRGKRFHLACPFCQMSLTYCSLDK